MNRYRNKDGRFVTRDEAFDGGILRDGYSVIVSMLFADADAQLSVADAERVFADSVEGQAAVAYARMVHGLTRPGEAFTAADEANAINDAMPDTAAYAAARQHWEREAELAGVIADATHCQMIERLTQ